MELNYRTFLRHALLAGVLIASLFFIEGFQGFSVRELVARNAVFLGSWFIACPLLGWMGHRLVTAGLLSRWTVGVFALLTGRTGFQLYRAHRRAVKSSGRRRRGGTSGRPAGFAGIVSGLFLKWASCSRCVAWWAGGVFSLIAHIAYWPQWPAAVYFAALGASLAAATGVFLYLREFATIDNAR